MVHLFCVSWKVCHLDKSRRLISPSVFVLFAMRGEQNLWYAGSIIRSLFHRCQAGLARKANMLFIQSASVSFPAAWTEPLPDNISFLPCNSLAYSYVFQNGCRLQFAFPHTGTHIRSNGLEVGINLPSGQAVLLLHPYPAHYNFTDSVSSINTSFRLSFVLHNSFCSGTFEVSNSLFSEQWDFQKFQFHLPPLQSLPSYHSHIVHDSKGLLFSVNTQSVRHDAIKT